MDGVEFQVWHYRAGAGEIAGGGAVVAWTGARRVEKELVEPVVVHLQTGNSGHCVPAVFTHHQWSTGRHHRATPLKLTASCK